MDKTKNNSGQTDGVASEQSSPECTASPSTESTSTIQ
jgi:hypothetical protein